MTHPPALSSMLVRGRGVATTLIAAGVLCLAAGPVLAAGDGAQGPSVAVFFWQIIALLLCGRLLVEAMQRLASPPYWGSLLPVSCSAPRS